MEQTKRMDNLDLMKALGILMVITIHVPLWKPEFMETDSVGRLVQYAFRIISEGVPIFVTINGLLLLKKKNMCLKAHVEKMLRLFLVLILWGGVLAVVGMHLDNNVDTFTLKDVLRAVLNIQVGAPYTGVLWFLQNLLAVYLVYPLLWYLFNEKYGFYEYLFGVVTAFVLGLRTLGFLRDILSTRFDTEMLSRGIDFMYRLNPIGNGWYVFYFMLGGIMWHYLDAIKSNRVLLGVLGILSWPAAFGLAYYISVSTGATYDPSFNYGSIFMVAFLLGMFALTIQFENRNALTRVVCSVGKNTLGMYLGHYLFIFLIYHFWNVEKMQERLLAYLAVCIGSYVLSLALNPLLKKI